MALLFAGSGAGWWVRSCNLFLLYTRGWYSRLFWRYFYEHKTGQKCAFGFGAFGKDIVYMLISSYLLYYYNVVLGMSSVFIGTVMMAARIFDAFNDPVMCIIVAKTRTRWGRFRPWIFAGTVLNAVTIYALYATPESMGDSAQRVWLTVFYFAWGITLRLWIFRSGL